MQVRELVLDRVSFQRPILSILIEWLIAFILIGFGSVGELTTSKIAKPNYFHYPGRNTQMNINFEYPKKDSTVSNGSLMAICLLPWIIVMISSCVLMKIYQTKIMNRKTVLLQLELMLRMVVILFSITGFITAMIKIHIGYPRPYYITLEKEPNISEMDLNQAQYSFPSGHSSLSFGMGTFLVMHFNKAYDYALKCKYQNRDIMFNISNPHSYYLSIIFYKTVNIRMIIVLIMYTPIYLAFLSAFSRIVDYKHHSSDVIAGSLLGIGCAVSVYYYYYIEQYGKWETTQNGYKKSDNNKDIEMIN